MPHLSARDATAVHDPGDAVLEVVADHLRTGRPDPGASLADDLGADSLAVLDLGMRLEDEFDVWLDDAALAACRTAGDLVAAVAAARDQRA